MIQAPSPNVFEEVSEIIINDINTWLKDQGHEFEHEAERSIKIILEKTGDKYILSAEAVDYVLDLEYGVSPQEMQRKDIDVQKLERWVKYRRSQGHVVPGVNRLIKKWAEQGFELSGAANYSNKPRINLAITDTIAQNESNYYENIDDVVFNYLDLQVLQTKSGTI